MNKKPDEHRAWNAIVKFAAHEPLSEAEWADLSQVTLIDKSRPVFERGNCRWATSAAERADNLRFYQTVGTYTLH